MEDLHALIGQVRDSVPSAGNPAGCRRRPATARTSAKSTNFAHAWIWQGGNLEKGRQLLSLKLTQLKPHNQLHTRNYRASGGKIGRGGIRFATHYA